MVALDGSRVEMLWLEAVTAHKKVPKLGSFVRWQLNFRNFVDEPRMTVVRKMLGQLCDLSQR